MPVIRVPNTTALSSADATSKGIPERGVAGSARQAMAIAAAPIGRLTANNQGQLATERMAAATVGPTAAEIDPTVALSPKPRPIMRRG